MARRILRIPSFLHQGLSPAPAQSWVWELVGLPLGFLRPQGHHVIQAQQPQLLHQLQKDSWFLQPVPEKGGALGPQALAQVHQDRGWAGDRQGVPCWRMGRRVWGGWGLTRQQEGLSVGPLQAAGKQQSLEEKGSGSELGPEDHRPDLDSGMGLGPGQLYQRDTATADSYAGCPPPRHRGRHSVYTCTTLHGNPDEAAHQSGDRPDVMGRLPTDYKLHS